MHEFRITLSQDDWDEGIGGWYCSALKLPGSSVEDVYVRGAQVDRALYHVDADQEVIRWAGEQRPEEIKVALGLSTALTKRTTTHFWQALSLILPVVSALGGAAIGAYSDIIVARGGTSGPQPSSSISDSLSKEGSALLRAALTAGRPYAIPTLVAWVTLDSVGGDSSASLQATQRIVYSLQATRTFVDTDNEFEEWFHGITSEIEYLPGVDREEVVDFAPQDKRWYVAFDMNRSEYRSTVTGVLRRYRSGMRTGRKDHAGRQLATREEEFCYPNSGDVIGELLLVVESSVLEFQAGNTKTRAYRKNPGQNPRPVPVSLFGPQQNSPTRNVAAARLRNVGQKENGCIIISW
jgi:hypothetical protein